MNPVIKQQEAVQGREPCFVLSTARGWLSVMPMWLFGDEIPVVD